LMMIVDDDGCWWWWLLLMIVVVDDDDCCWWRLLLMMMMIVDDEIKLCKIENYQDSSFQNFASRIVFFLNVFYFSRKLFQNLLRRGVRGGVGWCGAGTWKPKEKPLNSNSKYFFFKS
jgi:hypothetical protein